MHLHEAPSLIVIAASESNCFSSTTPAIATRTVWPFTLDLATTPTQVQSSVRWRPMEWNGMTTPTERALMTYTHCVCYLQPIYASTKKH